MISAVYNAGPYLPRYQDMAEYSPDDRPSAADMLCYYFQGQGLAQRSGEHPASILQKVGSHWTDNIPIIKPRSAIGNPQESHNSIWQASPPHHSEYGGKNTHSGENSGNQKTPSKYYQPPNKTKPSYDVVEIKPKNRGGGARWG